MDRPNELKVKLWIHCPPAFLENLSIAEESKGRPGSLPGGKILILETASRLYAFSVYPTRT